MRGRRGVVHQRSPPQGEPSSSRDWIIFGAMERGGRFSRRLLCLSLLSVCAVGSNAIYVESDPSAEVPAYCTLFHHQVKAAGTTIKDKLETASLEAGLEVPGLCVTGPGFEQSCLEAANGTHPVITGYTELLRGVMQERGRQCDFFTVLRHPIDRLISAFFYCPERDPQSRPKQWCGHEEDDPDVVAAVAQSTQLHLLEFAKRNWRSMTFRQMLFGLFPPPHAFMEKAKVRQDMDNPETLALLAQVEGILGTYTAVGILEHWDLSMDLFNARVKSPVRDWKVEAVPDHLVHLGVHKANVGKESELRRQVHQWARTSPDIRAALTADLLLYDFAVAVFMQQTEEALGTQW